MHLVRCIRKVGLSLFRWCKTTRAMAAITVLRDRLFSLAVRLLDCLATSLGSDPTPSMIRLQEIHTGMEDVTRTSHTTHQSLLLVASLHLDHLDLDRRELHRVHIGSILYLCGRAYLYFAHLEHSLGLCCRRLPKRRRSLGTKHVVDGAHP